VSEWLAERLIPLAATVTIDGLDDPPPEDDEGDR
jgi:hypothetical protein